MDENIKKVVVKALRDKADEIDVGNSNLTSDEAMSIMSTIAHEAEHVKQAVLKAYHVDDVGEAAAYTIGFNCNNSIHKGRRFSGLASLCFLCHLKKYGEKFGGFRINAYLCTA